MSKKILYIGNKLSIHGNTTTSIETLGEFFEEEGFTVFYASSKKNKVLRLLDMIFTTIATSQKVNYVFIDVYSTQNFWFALIISQICRILNKKYITKLHGGNLPYRLKKNPFLCNWIFKNAYKISAPSKYLYHFFEKKYKSNLIYIPNTIKINNYHFQNREIQVPHLLWVRSLAKIYNPRMTIKVFFEIKKQYQEATLTMVGPDKENLLPELKKLSNHLNLSVNFTGKLEKEEWIELSKQNNIFLNTTHFDNTPISVIEAMALGLPVISTNVGGIPFLLSHNKDALLVNDNDVFKMVKCIQKLVNNKELKNDIVTNARSKVEQFDWQIVKHNWHEILK